VFVDVDIHSFHEVVWLQLPVFVPFVRGNCLIVYVTFGQKCSVTAPAEEREREVVFILIFHYVPAVCIE
jgi:hypothetical protein